MIVPNERLMTRLFHQLTRNQIRFCDANIKQLNEHECSIEIKFKPHVSVKYTIDISHAMCIVDSAERIDVLSDDAIDEILDIVLHEWKPPKTMLELGADDWRDAEVKI